MPAQANQYASCRDERASQKALNSKKKAALFTAVKRARETQPGICQLGRVMKNKPAAAWDELNYRKVLPFPLPLCLAGV